MVKNSLLVKDLAQKTAISVKFDVNMFKPVKFIV